MRPSASDIAEKREYLGYDSTLATGPYNFGWSLSQPDRVEHFPYQDGLLISCWNTACTNDDISQQHPGAGLVLPVDSAPAALRWSDGTVARNRIQTSDATSGDRWTDPLLLHRETQDGTTTVSVPAHRRSTVFDDSDPMRCHGPANPGGSVQVAGVGVRIRVLSDNLFGQTTIRVSQPQAATRAGPVLPRRGLRARPRPAAPALPEAAVSSRAPRSSRRPGSPAGPR